MTELRKSNKKSTGLSFGAYLVGLVGLEPMTPTMSTWCSNQLSYNPMQCVSQLTGIIITHAGEDVKPFFNFF